MVKNKLAQGKKEYLFFNKEAPWTNCPVLEPPKLERAHIMEEKMDSKQPRWQRRKDVRPQEIIRAALELFVQQGYSATKVDQVARKAGVTPGTLYVYFENKEALLKAVVYESIGPVFAYADRKLEEYQGSAEDLVRLLIRQWWEQIGNGRFAGIPKLIVAEAQNYPELAKFYVHEVQERGREIIRRILAYGVQKGEFEVADASVTARIIMAPLQFAAIYAHSLAAYDDEIDEIDDYLDALAELVLRGIMRKT